MGLSLTMDQISAIYGHDTIAEVSPCTRNRDVSASIIDFLGHVCSCIRACTLGKHTFNTIQVKDTQRAAILLTTYLFATPFVEDSLNDVTGLPFLCL